MAIELSIIMPCLNEAETIEACVRKAVRYLSGSGIAGEVVIGDNGSTDGSQEIALRAGARVVNVPLRGYGAALYSATLAARGRYVIMGDSDDSYDFSDLDSFVGNCAKAMTWSWAIDLPVGSSRALCPGKTDISATLFSR